MIKGENIYLRLTEKYDLNIIMDMYKDVVSDKVTFNKHRMYIYKNFDIIMNSPLTCLSLINEKGVLAGFVTYINEGNDTYKVGITVGQRFRNRGYGKEAINLLIDHLFVTHNAKSITLEVKIDNEIAIKCYMDCGFVIKNNALSRGIGEDIIYMERVNSDYKCYEKICS